MLGSLLQAAYSKGDTMEVLHFAVHFAVRSVWLFSANSMPNLHGLFDPMGPGECNISLP